ETARFNLALGLERVGLDEQAQRAWKAFLEVDSTSRWAEEARQRGRPPADVPDLPQAPKPEATDSEIAAYVRAGPEAAMLFGWDHALDSCALAIGAGDSRRADEFLSLAGRIGDDLERGNRDATLAEAVRAIRATDRPSGLAALARAHHE